VSEVKKQIYE